MVYTSCFTSCRTTEDLRPHRGAAGGTYAHTRKKKKRLKTQENLKTSQNYNLVPSLPPKLKIPPILAENCRKIEIKAFPHCAISHEN